MPMGEVRLNSITLIRVRLGTERESQREGSHRGREGVGRWRGRGRQRQRTDNTDGRSSEGGRCMMNRDRPTESTKKAKEQFMLCPLSVQ